MRAGAEAARRCRTMTGPPAQLEPLVLDNDGRADRAARLDVQPRRRRRRRRKTDGRRGQSQQAGRARALSEEKTFTTMHSNRLGFASLRCESKTVSRPGANIAQFYGATITSKAEAVLIARRTRFY